MIIINIREQRIQRVSKEKLSSMWECEDGYGSGVFIIVHVVKNWHEYTGCAKKSNTF